MLDGGTPLTRGEGKRVRDSMCAGSRSHYTFTGSREIGAANPVKVGMELTPVVGPFGHLASSNGDGA